MEDEDKTRSQLIDELRETRKQLLLLTQPLANIEDISFEDLFNLSDIQHLQDLYADAFGVAALITRPDGTPITQPSNFTILCSQFIRNTEKGNQNCNISDAMIGAHNSSGPVIQPGLSAGLCKAGTRITVRGRHVANLLIGQVRNENQKEEDIMAYAKELGVDNDGFRAAYRRVPTMSQEQFKKVAQVFFTMARQLSTSAYQNVQQARVIAEKKETEKSLQRTQFIFNQALKESKERLDLALFGANERIWDWRRTENILYLDDRYYTMAGYIPHEFPNKVEEILKRIHPDDLGHIISLNEQCLTGELDIFETEFRFRRKDGRYMWIQAKGKIISRDSDGNPVHFIGINADITERKRMEELIIQNEKMLAVGGLAAGMAHEINNPIGGIVQTAQAVARRLKAGASIPKNQKAAEAAGVTMESIDQFMEDRGIHRLIEVIRLSGLRVSRIVNNMLSFARKDDAAVSAHYLNEILDNAIELAATVYDMKKIFDFKKIKIIREYDDRLPAVPCQASKIQQVLLNILTNGTQAMQSAGTQNGTFVIRTCLDLTRNMACIKIKDNGPGMDEKTRKHIFEPFFTTKPKAVGTGLGLSVSYFIITEDHHGEMTVESSPGAGAQFNIRLPLSAGTHF